MLPPAEASMPDAQKLEAIWGGCPGEPNNRKAPGCAQMIPHFIDSNGKHGAG